MNRYGYVDSNEKEGYPLAAWIWGHRLRIGQDWMEYLLEFLNVLAGFDYKLGQGINQGSHSVSEFIEYKRFARLGLRRFVFYHEREKTRHPDDDQAHTLLIQELQKKVEALDTNLVGEPVNLIRSLMQAFSAVEAQRSWYAKSLFPAHHNLLLWEALRKGATKYKGRTSSNKPTAWLDKEIRFDQRNFFARGGEIYYLILSAGTERFPEKRDYIAKRLEELLKQSNAALGEVALLIDQTWSKLCYEGKDNPAETLAKTGKLGWIPYQNTGFYEIVAEDIYQLLHANLDSLELLDLLAHLIGFHITLYIYQNANQNSEIDLHENYNLLIDAMEGADGGIIRGISASLFSEQEAHIVRRGRIYVREQVEAHVASYENPNDFIHNLESDMSETFGLGGLHKNTLQSFKDKVNKSIEQFNGGNLTKDAFIGRYVESLTDILLNDFRKNFLGVHKKLAKAIEFVAPRKGPSGRFVLGDTLLKAITVANLMPGQAQIYYEFLRRLYDRYGLIVGPDDARGSGLLERKPINEQYYRLNQDALLEKMKHAGLAIEYSDATAIVIHHQTVSGGEHG